MWTLRTLALPLIIGAAVSCGGGERKGEAAGGRDMAEPPSAFARMGIEATLPVRWVESGERESEVREYYEEVTGYEGPQRDIAVRTNLVVSQQPPAPLRHYELTEIRIKDSKVTDTSKSSGDLTVEQVLQDGESFMVYRLTGDGTPETRRVFVRTGDKLHVADPAHLAAGRDMGSSVLKVATTTHDQVEIGEYVMDLMNWKIRLRRGQELKVLLDNTMTAHSYKVEPKTLGGVLEQVESTEMGKAQTIRFKAVAPGWTDLEMNSGSPYTVRVKVD